MSIMVECPRCEAEIEIEGDVEVSESYANHGLSCFSHECFVPDLPPDRCPEGCEWTEEEKARLQQAIDMAAEEWEPPHPYDNL